MCRMAGIVFRRRFPTEVLADLKEIAQNGRVPDESAPGHPHGWGVVSFRKQVPFYLTRSTDPIFRDPDFGSVIKAVEEIPPPNILIAHARHASKGVVKEDNTHPFIEGSVVLAHNGTIQGMEPPSKRRPRGETDSERLALVLAELYDEKRDLRSAMRSLVEEVIRGKEFTAAVVLASDGKALAGYRDYSRNGDYYDLRIASSADSVILFQESHSKFASRSEQVGKGELVTVDLDLGIARGTI